MDGLNLRFGDEATDITSPVGRPALRKTIRPGRDLIAQRAAFLREQGLLWRQVAKRISKEQKTFVTGKQCKGLVSYRQINHYSSEQDALVSVQQETSTGESQHRGKQIFYAGAAMSGQKQSGQQGGGGQGGDQKRGGQEGTEHKQGGDRKQGAGDKGASQKQGAQK